jgi:hypothetical protein
MRTSISHLCANLIALVIGGVLFAGVVAADWRLWHRAAESGAYEFSALAFLIVTVASIYAHEWLHVVGFHYFGRIPLSRIRVSVKWRALTPYATTAVPLRARAYWWSAALPGIVLGALPAAAGLILGVWQLSGYGAMMLAAASGDWIVLWMLRRVDAAATVRDHPTLIGFEIVPADGQLAPTS